MPTPFAPLIDERFGLIRRLRLVPQGTDLPPALYHVQAEVCASHRFCPWHSDDRSAGFAWDSTSAAKAAAAGEAVERYCGNLVPAGLRRASWEELNQVGERAIDPRRLALFSERQYTAPGFPFTPFTRCLPVLWTRGRSLLDGETVWVPASLVWVTYFTGRPTRTEPRTHATPYAGIAAGADRRQAEVAALLELLERDALSLAWHRGDRLPQLAVPSWMSTKVETAEVRCTFHLFPSDFGVPVIGVLAHDQARDLPALGVAARADAATAAFKAAAEAHQLLHTSRILDDPNSRYMRQVQRGAPGLGVKPWRSDRRYRRRYRSDWRDVWDLLCHLQLYHDPAMRGPLAERFSEEETLPINALPDLSLGAEQEGLREEIAQRLAARGYEPVSVDVTTPDVAVTGLRVVRVIAPGLYGNAPAAFPYLGGPRLEAKRAAEDLYLWPLPYA